MNALGLPELGLGVGLRAAHLRDALADSLAVDFYEVITENVLGSRGRAREAVGRLARARPVVLHGVSLSIGGADPLNLDYLRGLRALADELGVVWVSDHLCWTGVGGHTSHDLLPLPYTPEALAHVIERVKVVQDTLGRPLVLENASTYATWRCSTIPEAEFLGAVADRAGGGVLLDVNNVYVSCRNHGWDAAAYLDALPWERVVELHVAGHLDRGDHCIDTHDRRVCDAVLGLCAEARRRVPGAPLLLEWDDHIPPWRALVAEARRVRAWVDL